MRCLLGAAIAAGGERREGGGGGCRPWGHITPPQALRPGFCAPSPPLSRQAGPRLPGHSTAGSPGLLRRPRAGPRAAPAAGAAPGRAGVGAGRWARRALAPLSSAVQLSFLRALL